MTIKILTVDSSADVRHLVEVCLKKESFQVIAAANGDEAVQVAAAEQPDVVICGVRLPGLDGLALTRRLKAQPHPPLVIFLTILGSDRDIAAGFRAGADDYMAKPFSPLALAERVRVNLVRAGRIAPAVQPESEAPHA